MAKNSKKIDPVGDAIEENKTENVESETVKKTRKPREKKNFIFAISNFDASENIQFDTVKGFQAWLNDLGLSATSISDDGVIQTDIGSYTIVRGSVVKCEVKVKETISIV